MALRDALRVVPPPEPLVAEFKALGQRLIERAERGEDCSELLLELTTRTGGLDYGWEYFADFGGGDSLEDFAERAALGAAPFVPDIAPAELVEVVELICKDPRSAVSDYYLDL